MSASDLAPVQVLVQVEVVDRKVLGERLPTEDVGDALLRRIPTAARTKS